ncbi:MAG: RluA family pseudouridine synthase [Myxococcota bacterium]|nr:RluA family pseudouridine synthase [Myxococcota bacterium]
MKDRSPWRVLKTENVENGHRLDVWISRQISELSRRQAQALIISGDVTVNGKVPPKGTPLNPGDEVAIWIPPTPPNWAPAPNPDLALDVIYVDPHMLAIDKQSGIPSTPLSPGETNALACGIVSRFPECAHLGKTPGDGGLIQRLDLETSGLVLAARTQAAYTGLVNAQRSGAIEKRYLALIADTGRPIPRIIDTKLAPAGPHRRLVRPNKSGVPAVTEIRPCQSCGPWMLVEAIIYKGQRHQIRAHLASQGFPIVGDTQYGNASPQPGLDRLFLHAAEIRLNHPITGKPLTLIAPLPPDLRAFIERS